MIIRNLCLASILIFLTLQSACAQNKKEDSLKIVLSKTAKGERASMFRHLVRAVADKDNEKALLYAKAACHASLKVNDSLEILRSGRMLGQIYKRLQKFDSAVIVYEKFIPLALRLNAYDELLYIYSSKAPIHTYEGDFEEALRCFNECKKVPGFRNDTTTLMNVMMNMGFMYYKMVAYDSAKKFYLGCLKLKREKSLFDLDYKQLMLNLSLCYFNENDFNSGEKYIDSVARLCDTTCPDQIKMETFFVKGFMNFFQGHLRPAEQYFIRSKGIAIQTDNSRHIVDNIFYLGKIYLELGEFSKAQVLLEEGDKLIINFPFERDKLTIYKLGIDLNRALKDYRGLSVYQAKYISLYDSLFSENRITHLMHLAAEARSHDAEMKVEFQNELLTLKDKLIVWQYIVIGIAGGLSLVLVLFSVMMFKRSRERKNSNVLLEKKVAERTMEFKHEISSLHRALADREQAIIRYSKDTDKDVQTVMTLISLYEKDEGNRKAYLSNISNLLSARKPFDLY